jgi:hypothetical protein
VDDARALSRKIGNLVAAAVVLSVAKLLVRWWWRVMRSKASLLLLLCALLALSGCQDDSEAARSTSDTGRQPATQTATGPVDGVECQNPSPAKELAEGSGPPMEVRGEAEGAELWALVFGNLPLRADKRVKIVWRMTGSGPLKLGAEGPDGERIRPAEEPQEHAGSTWHRPGEEWGSVFVFPKAGCWTVRATRGPMRGEVRFWVRAAARSSADVEREAQSYPQAPPPKELPANFKQEHPGSPKRECVYVNPLLDELGRDGAIRSGQVVAGPFGHFVRGWNPYIENKLWVAPLHTSRMPGATIERVPLDGQREVSAVRYEQVAWGAEDALRGSREARSTRFYPGGLRLPEAGRWRLVVTSGPDWGCFELTLSEG